jgi:Tol biopolymer transport system component
MTASDPEATPGGSSQATARDALRPGPDLARLDTASGFHDQSDHARDRTAQTSTDLGIGATAVAWSPDGIWLAYVGTAAEGRSHGVWMVDPDGGDPKRLTPDLGGVAPWLSWSPDSSGLAFSCCSDSDTDSGASDIWTVGVDGTTHQMTRGLFEHEFMPVWSPDGTRVAFEEGGTIEVMGADGSGRRDVYDIPPARAAGPFAKFPWSPDGTMLLAVRYRADSLVVIPVDGSEPWSYPASLGTASWQRLVP